MENKRIYKYFSINEYLFMTLINRELFFSNPKNFNDPYDSTPRFNLTENKQLVSTYFEFLKVSFNTWEEFTNSNRMIGENIEELFQIMNFYKIPNIFDKLWDKDSTKLQITLYKHFLFILNSIHKFGVCCFSTTPNSPLMWSHYANNHKGICIEFLTEDKDGVPLFKKEEKKNFILEKVDYSDNPINFFREKLPTEDGDVNTKILTTKSSKWSYEEEIRFVTEHQGLLKFNPKCLNKIIFGTRTTSKEIYTICSLIGHYYGRQNSEITFKKSQMLFDEYHMSTENMTLNDIAGSGVTLEELNL